MPVTSAVYRSLAALHRAGVPWPQALASAAGSDTKLIHAQSALAGGAGLADALAPEVDPLDLALLRAGEHTGALDTTLDRLAARHDAEERDRGTRRAALLYPFFMAHVAACLLPIPDLVMGGSLRGLLWSAAVLLPVYVFLVATRRRRVDSGAARHPGSKPPRAAGVFKNAVQEADARGFTALADCLEAGVPLNRTLELVVAAGAGGRVAWDVYRAMPRVRDGVPLSACWLAVAGPYREQLVSAEQAGELDQAARHAAARLRFEVETRRRQLNAVLPVVLLLFVGGVIAWRVIGFYADNLPPF